MSFTGQFNFGNPITRKNILDSVDDSAVIPVGLQNTNAGNTFGIKVGDLKSQFIPSYTNCNINIGEEALNSVSLGNNNVAIGCAPLKDNSSSTHCIAIGTDSARLSEGGSDCIFLGYKAGYKNTDNGNIGIGHETMSENTITGIRNIAIGAISLKKLADGEYNIGIGSNALGDLTTGDSNICISNQAGDSITTGDSNICIGKFSGVGITVLSNNICIGESTNAGGFKESIILGKDAVATGNNQFVVGSSTTNVGSIVTAPATQTAYWNVRINGTAYKILLAV